MPARRFASIWNAASLRTALPGPGVMTAGTTTSSPIPAKPVVCEGVHIEPDWDLAAQPAPDYEVDQRVSW